MSFSIFPGTISLSGWWQTGFGRHYQKTTNNSTFIQYELYDSNGEVGPGYGSTFTADSTGILLNVEDVGDGATPFSFSKNGSLQGASGYVSTGDTITLWVNTTGTGTPEATFTVPNFGYTAAASGPTVTAITVANSVSSTRNFTVTHTGTLSASDIKYFIDGVNITSLPSPNTPITNLQTTATGSTFDSYTVNKYGFHSVHVGNEKVQFTVSLSTTQDYDYRLTNNNITVTWPTTDAEWLSEFAYDNKLTTNSRFIYLNSETTDSLGVVTSGETLTIDPKYTNPQTLVWGYYVSLLKYDLTTNTGSYSEFYWDPVLNLSYTWNPDPASDYISNNNYTFDFATQSSQNNSNSETRGTNAAGKRDRYPLIMTNLFNRSRSVFSIGLTHKDKWDLFL